MRKTTVNIPEPCQERWAAMHPISNGRHCASCQEAVVDFTRMTDAEVVAFLRQYPAVSCGRFRESQLNRELLAAAQPMGGWRRWATAAVALLGLGSLAPLKALAQVVPAKYWGGPAPASATSQPSQPIAEAPTTVSPVNPTQAARRNAAPQSGLSANGDILVVTGVVHDRLGFRMARARVKIRVDYRTVASAISDSRGHFSIAVPTEKLTDSASIRATTMPRNKRVGSYYLQADEPLDLERTRPYVLHLKRHERIRGGKFR